MRKLTYIFLICSSLSVLGQKNIYPKGEIIDSVKVGNESDETFTLYLPNQFDSSKLSPIVFIFDPLARGKIGVEPFIKAAEKYGYILVCSNNSKNGPYERNFAIADRLFVKIFSDFATDPNRMYTSGFSGGARLASTIAVITKQIQGVIACGAGFGKTPPHNTNFSYVTIVGDEDMNLLETYKVKDYLNKLKTPHQLFIYEMNHKWPSQDQILDAFDWLQLEANRKGIVSMSAIEIDNIYINYYLKAKNLEKKGKLASSADEYERILNTFGSYYKLDSISSKLSGLFNNKILEKEKKLLKSIFEEEVTLTKMFSERFNKDINKSNRKLKWWKTEIDKLKSQKENLDLHQKKMLNRLLYKIFALAIETVDVTETLKKVDQAIFCNDICILVYPNYSYPYFKQIENYINTGNEKQALNYLEKLLKTGYNDVNSIKNNKAFKSLLNNERFKRLIKTN